MSIIASPSSWMFNKHLKCQCSNLKFIKFLRVLIFNKTLYNIYVLSSYLMLINKDYVSSSSVRPTLTLLIVVVRRFYHTS